MNRLDAFMMGKANRGKEQMVFDWDEAARRIVAQGGDCRASAGLGGDWEYTGGTIYENGVPIPQDETYTYLASTWATPEIDINGDVQPCFKMQSDLPGWNEETYWPDSARAILADARK